MFSSRPTYGLCEYELLYAVVTHFMPLELGHTVAVLSIDTGVNLAKRCLPPINEEGEFEVRVAFHCGYNAIYVIMVSRDIYADGVFLYGPMSGSVHLGMQ